MLSIGLVQGECLIMTQCLEPKMGWRFLAHHLDKPLPCWVLSHVPLELALHYSTWHTPDDFACKLQVVASMFNDTVMGGHGHCLYIGHWPLVDFTLAHWTVAMG